MLQLDGVHLLALQIGLQTSRRRRRRLRRCRSNKRSWLRSLRRHRCRRCACGLCECTSTGPAMRSSGWDMLCGHPITAGWRCDASDRVVTVCNPCRP